MDPGARTIRHADASDAMAIGLVHVRSWQATYRGRFPQEYLDGLDPAHRGKGWRRYLEGGPGDREAQLIASIDEHIVGFANLGPSRDEDANGDGEVRAIYLLPERWAQGVGRDLMAVGLETLAGFGFERAALWVLDTNERARRFYDAGGWTPDGATKRDDRFGFPITEVRYRRATARTSSPITGRDNPSPDRRP
jgi:GNAT superfamily N-acetyltransferase